MIHGVRACETDFRDLFKVGWIPLALAVGLYYCPKQNHFLFNGCIKSSLYWEHQPCARCSSAHDRVGMSRMSRFPSFCGRPPVTGSMQSVWSVKEGALVCFQHDAGWDKKVDIDIFCLLKYLESANKETRVRRPARRLPRACVESKCVPLRGERHSCPSQAYHRFWLWPLQTVPGECSAMSRASREGTTNLPGFRLFLFRGSQSRSVYRRRRRL